MKTRRANAKNMFKIVAKTNAGKTPGKLLATLFNMCPILIFQYLLLLFFFICKPGTTGPNEFTKTSPHAGAHLSVIRAGVSFCDTRANFFL